MIPLWIIGSGGHAKVVIDTARATGDFEVAGCLDDDSARIGDLVLGVPVVGSISVAAIEEHWIEHAVIAIGSNAIRRSIVSRIGHAVTWATLVHPRACIAPTALFGEGTVVLAGAVVQPDVHLGDHVILNTSASVDHDSHVGDFAHVGPGSHLGGNTAIGEGAFLGIGSRVIPAASVGHWTIVGAGSTVIHDLPPDVTAVGTPAGIIKQREMGWHLV